MRRDYKRLKIALAVIVIALLMAYAFIAYMPHRHECARADCVVCNAIDIIEDILFITALLSIAQLLLLFTFILPFTHGRIVCLEAGTPVGLKDKLSD